MDCEHAIWEEFMATQARLRDNASAFARRARGVPRAGHALLAGLVVCGHCGRQMHGAYRAQPCYRCTALQKVFGQRGCLHLPAPAIDAAVVDAFFGIWREFRADQDWAEKVTVGPARSL